ncbi:MAG: HlyD family secretion protein [Clostridia bacterium]|nr:HlyD family secretion protein [Clostridia bacterium]
MKKIDYRVIIIVILIAILVGMIFLVTRSESSNNAQTQKNNYDITTEQSVTGSITGTSEITTGLEENLSLHATYYFKEIYVEENQKVTAGENILQYTNGEYLVAPYDCVIIEISVPETNSQCTNKHYITISSTKVLQAKVKVSEEKIDSIEIGDEATVTIEAVEKEYTANVTNISSTASNGYFTITVEFENDGNVLLGMTGKVEI